MHCPLYNIHRQQLVDSFNKLNIEFTIQTILYGSETSDYNQNVKLFRALHSEAFVPEFSLVLNILRERLVFVKAGRPFQSRNVQGMKLLLYTLMYLCQLLGVYHKNIM
jgi:hypothetical protein